MNVQITTHALAMWRDRHHTGDKNELINEFYNSKRLKLNELPRNIKKIANTTYYYNAGLGCYFVCQDVKIDYVKIITVIYPGIPQNPILTHKPKRIAPKDAHDKYVSLKSQIKALRDELNNFKPKSDERKDLNKRIDILNHKLAKYKEGYKEYVRIGKISKQPPTAG